MEQWVGVKGFEGCYKVSSYGRVLSLSRKIRSKHKSGYRVVRQRVLKSRFRSDGYTEVVLCHERTAIHKLVHRLVAQAFIGNPDEYEQVNHINGNKENNRINNLEWCSRAMNMKHRAEVLGIGVGEDNPSVKLSKTDVKVIRCYLNNVYKVKDLAREFRVSPSAIYKIKENRTWRSI